MKTMRKYGGFFVGISLIAFLLFRTDFSEIRRAFSQFQPVIFFMLAIMQFITMLVITAQWRLLAFHMADPIRFKSLFVMNMGGALLESVTPAAKSGGEMYKVYYLRVKEAWHSAQALSLVGVQKLCSFTTFLVLFLVALVLMLWQGIVLEGALLHATLGFLGLVVGIVGVTLVLVFKQHKTRWFADLKKALMRFKEKRMLWGGHVGIGLLIWFFYVLKTTVLLEAFDVSMPFVVALSATMIAYTVSMLPITPGGLGTFEGTFVWIATRFMVDAGIALVVVLTLRLFTFWMRFLVSVVVVAFVHVKGWLPHAKTA